MSRPKAKRPLPKVVASQKVQSVASKITPPEKVTVPPVTEPKVQPKFSVQPLSNQQIRDLVAQKWQDAEQEKWAMEEKLFESLIKGIRDSIFSGNFQALASNEISVYLNDLEIDTPLFNKLMPSLNIQLSELGIRVIRGSLGFGDGVSVLQVHIQVFSY